MAKVYSVLETDGRGAVQRVIHTTFDKAGANKVMDERVKEGPRANQGFKVIVGDVRLPKAKVGESDG